MYTHPTAQEEYNGTASVWPVAVGRGGKQRFAVEGLRGNKFSPAVPRVIRGLRRKNVDRTDAKTPIKKKSKKKKNTRTVKGGKKNFYAHIFK